MYEQPTVDILVNGKPIKKYFKNGVAYVESKHDVEYAIKVRNNSYKRLLYVVSVDGINVIDGQAAGSSNAGYVLNGYGSLDVKGFRTSNEAVHPFKFSAKRHSYAAKSEATGGDTQNCGVIGVQVFEEKYEPRPVYRRQLFRSGTTADFPEYLGGQMIGNDYPSSTLLGLTGPVGAVGPSGPEGGYEPASYSASSSSESYLSKGLADTSLRRSASLNSVRSFDMGTEFSKEEVTDRVTDVEFKIGNNLGTTSIYYASFDALKSMDVQVTKEKQIALPNPFPSRFCKPPTN